MILCVLRFISLIRFSTWSQHCCCADHCVPYMTLPRMYSRCVTMYSVQASISRVCIEVLGHAIVSVFSDAIWFRNHAMLVRVYARIPVMSHIVAWMESTDFSVESHDVNRSKVDAALDYSSYIDDPATLKPYDIDETTYVTRMEVRAMSTIPSQHCIKHQLASHSTAEFADAALMLKSIHNMDTAATQLVEEVYRHKSQVTALANINLALHQQAACYHRSSNPHNTAHVSSICGRKRPARKQLEGGSKQSLQQLAETTTIHVRRLRGEMQHCTGLAPHVGKNGEQARHCYSWLLQLQVVSGEHALILLRKHVLWVQQPTVWNVTTITTLQGYC